MGQSLAQIYVHLIFSTEQRRPFLKDKATRDQAHAYLAGICRNQDSPAIIVGGVEDHVHILLRLGKRANVADIVREVKRDSSKWVKQQSPALAQFQWQNGYGAFSISSGHVDELQKYIGDQEEHHRRESFQDEFRRVCEVWG